MSESPGSSEFRERARLEANRYGPDPWVFVRELLQNARDAGATWVRFEVEEDGELTTIRCTDDGEGMGFDHARRYLFSLYASSKEEADNQVGRFGVGFWSVLRFEPTRIVIRSRPASDEAWEVALDGALEQAERRVPDMEPGTQVVLERAHSDGAQARRVRDAATQNARFLCQRDQPDEPLEITVNDERINAPFSLPAPSASFRRGSVRGVVGLGSAPRVELFSRGLRVRSAACLDDLLSGSGHTSHSRVRFPELPGALAPQALLESDGLELLLSRSDARDDRALRKLVKLANRELERLVDRQLAQIRPPGLLERLGGIRRRLFGDSIAPRVVLAVAGGVALAFGCARVLWGPPDDQELVGMDETLPVAAPPPMETTSNGEGYSDLASRYRGPRVSELGATESTRSVPLHYEPSELHPYFAALVVAQLDGEAAPLAGSRGDPEHYQGARCERDCVRVELELDAKPGVVRIPVPTGHRLDVASVRLGGRKLQVFRTENDEPVLLLSAASTETLRYQTGVAAAAPAIVPKLAAGLPSDLLRQARALRRRPREDRVATLVDVVRTRVEYSTSREVAMQHHQAIVAGEEFIDRTLKIGAGDCDVQNGILVAMLQAADVPARLAVGYVGNEGAVAPWLHAWAEYRTEDGRWAVADASSSPSARSLRIASAPPTVASTQVGPELEPGPDTSGDASDDPAAAVTSEPPNLEGREPIAAAAAGDSDDPSAAEDRKWLYGLSAVLAAMAFGLVLLLSWLTRTRRRFHLDEAGDLSKLLHGALQRPAAFRHLPALFQRKLIPLGDGSALSLNRARELAGDGRLFRSESKADLAARAIRKRVEVLDDERPEARTVGDTLGATDLDRWSRLLDGARHFPILDAVNQCLRRLGERWEVLAVETGNDTVASLDLRALRISGSTRRVVIIGENDPWLVEASARAAQKPAMAVLLLLDHLFERLNVSPDRRAELLTEPAIDALREANS